MYMLLYGYCLIRHMTHEHGGKNHLQNVHKKKKNNYKH